MINVLTIEREYGSGANEIARRVAERLGWTLWDQAMTTEVARMLECDCKHIEKQEERRDPLHYRLFKSFLRGSYEGSLASPSLKLADAEGIRCATEKLVNKVAKEGKCVIVGRGSAYYLNKSEDAFHVFVYAPFEDKVQRLKDQGKSEAEAVSLAETVDVDRADFIRQHFNVEWPARHYFHLMVNSAMGEETVIETILDGMNLYSQRAIEHR
jgi:cytidylate kinase